MYINLIKLIQQRILYPFIRRIEREDLNVSQRCKSHKDGHNDSVSPSKHVPKNVFSVIWFLFNLIL